MKALKKLRILLPLLLFLLCFFAFPTVTASADTGPKPSLTVTFDNLTDEPCYGTLLSVNEHYGPWSVWNGDEESAPYLKDDKIDEAVWKAFLSFKDEDGYYFLTRIFNVGETKNISWNYYPPKIFKVLLYFPEENIFLISDTYERYAFDSYYTMDMKNVTVTENAEGAEPLLISPLLTAKKSYDYTKEITGLIVRILVTIGLEILIALPFGIWKKKPLIFIAVTNATTQIILNVLLNIIIYQSGSLAAFIAYIQFELVVFLIEAIAYALFLNKCMDKPKPRGRYVLYAFVSNLASFILGGYMASFFPSVF